MGKQRKTVRELFLSETERLERKYNGQYRMKKIVRDRMEMACAFLDASWNESGVHDVVFLIDPVCGMDGDICANMDDIYASFRERRESADDLSSADNLSIQFENDELHVSFHYKDLWVVTA